MTYTLMFSEGKKPQNNDKLQVKWDPTKRIF